MPEPESEHPTRASDPAAWLQFRNNGFADTFEVAANALRGMADGLRAGNYGYPDDSTVAAMVHGIAEVLTKAREFYVNEAWQTANDAANELLAGLAARAEAPGLVETVARYLAEDPDASR